MTVSQIGLQYVWPSETVYPLAHVAGSSSCTALSAVCRAGFAGPAMAALPHAVENADASATAANTMNRRGRWYSMGPSLKERRPIYPPA